jgi:hypothetical protein
VLAAGFSKARSSLLAFVAVPPRLKQFLKVMVPTYVYGGPVPVAALATRLLGLESTSAGATDPASPADPHRARPPGQARGGHLQRLGLPDRRAGLADAEDLFPCWPCSARSTTASAPPPPPLRRSLGGLADLVRLLEFRT